MNSTIFRTFLLHSTNNKRAYLSSRCSKRFGIQRLSKLKQKKENERKVEALAILMRIRVRVCKQGMCT
uniref:Uncharacterized protein n=1 Tax=Glossina morsitans morsitans TaxID=37546 RepID=A0A1B0FDG3_GLOMM